ncbi:MAG: peptidylprolyl isomerase [Acidobacteria bacterium]|nr:peptidylprolyl isomerase [Acidobacteriota bacterium]
MTLGSAGPADAQDNPVVVLETSLGSMTVELFRDRAPITVDNFLGYVEDGFFEGTIFHRVIPNFMIQGGGLTPTLVEKATRPAIRNEAANGLTNDRGTLAMARTPVVDSATAQFFINLVDNPFLNHSGTDPQSYGYAVFGRLTEGLDVLDGIGAVRTQRQGPHQDVPVEPVVITSVTLQGGTP